MRKLSILFICLSILLSDVMCAHIAYLYCDMIWGMKLAVYSASASVVFLLAIPYSGIIFTFVIAAYVCMRKSRKK